MQQHIWVAPGEIETDLSGRVQLPKVGEDGWTMQTNAEQGSVGSSEQVFDDPDGDLNLVGLNAYRIIETASEADDPYIFAGSFADRDEERGPYRTGVSRIVRTRVTDLNSGLSKYVIREDEDGDRPQETVSDRMDWLLGTSSMDFLGADTSLIDSDSTVLAAGDLTDYSPQQILDDMAQQSGRNYFLFWDGVAEDEILVYKFDSDDHLTSDLRFSNIRSDVDESTTFFAGLDWKLNLDPARVVSYVVIRHANGRVAENDAATAAEFSRVDKVVDAPLVKTDGVAGIRALRLLNQLDSEESVLSGTVYLPASKASQFRAGMRCEMRAQHLTGLAEFVWVRLLRVTIVNISEDEEGVEYALYFEGTFNNDPLPECATILGSLNLQDFGETNWEGAADFGPDTGPSITPGTGDYLTVAMFAVGSGEISLTGATVDSPWTAGTVKPGDIGGSHTESVMAYTSGTPPADPVWDWDNYAYFYRQMAVTIPTAENAWTQEADIDGGSGGMTWDTPPTGLLILFRLTEGPTLWVADPEGAAWVKIGVNDWGGPGAFFGNWEVWVACAPDDPDELASGIAGSSWWAHCVEVTIT